MSNDRPEPSRPEEPDNGLDVDAAFADIVAHWEPSDASLWPEPSEEAPEATPEEPTDRDAPRDRPGDIDGDGLRHLFTPAWTPEPEPELDPGHHPGHESGHAAEEEHFVPPPPPPLPTLDPRRKAAWTCLVGTPVVALVLLVAGVVLPGWMAMGLVLTFVGGFGYLVATMGSSPPDDWSGSDGAVL